MVIDIAAIEHLTERIIGCAIEVHKTLGAGLLESVYRECLIIEMRNAQLRFERYVVVELKAIECIHPIHKSQVITYLKLSDCPAGLLLNFNVTVMKTGVNRLDHPDLYSQKKKKLFS